MGSYRLTCVLETKNVELENMYQFILSVNEVCIALGLMLEQLYLRQLFRRNSIERWGYSLGCKYFKLFFKKVLIGDAFQQI